MSAPVSQTSDDSRSVSTCQLLHTVESKSVSSTTDEDSSSDATSGLQDTTTRGATTSVASQEKTSSGDETTATSRSASAGDTSSVTKSPSSPAQATPTRIYVTAEFEDIKAELLDQIDRTRDALNQVFATLSRSAATRKAIREYVTALDDLVNLYV